jgi:hypothetical protein
MNSASACFMPLVKLFRTLQLALLILLDGQEPEPLRD